MGKLGKNLLGKLVGSDKSCCCCGPSIVSVKKIKVDNKDMEIAGLAEEFEKNFSAGKTPQIYSLEEVIRTLIYTNAIAET